MIGILLITHGPLGQNLAETARNMLGALSLPTDSISVGRDDDPDERLQFTQRATQALDQGDGVLLLTDAFGSTPSNVANQVANSLNYRVVAGVNLPMLVRIYNYPELSLDDIVNSAVEAGRQGILPCTEPPLSQHETDKKKHA